MQAADEAAPDRVAAGHEDDWYSRGRSFGRKRRWIAADCNDDGHLPLHEISDQRGQSIVLAIGPTIIDDDVSITDESGFTEGLLEQRGERRVRDWRTGAEQTDRRHRRLLSARRKRPCHRRAAQCKYEFSPSDVDCHATPPAGGRVHAIEGTISRFSEGTNTAFALRKS